MSKLRKDQVMRLKEITKTLVNSSREFRRLLEETDNLDGHNEVWKIRRELTQLAVEFIAIKDSISDDYPQWRDQS